MWYLDMRDSYIISLEVACIQKDKIVEVKATEDWPRKYKYKEYLIESSYVWFPSNSLSYFSTIRIFS